MSARRLAVAIAWLVAGLGLAAVAWAGVAPIGSRLGTAPRRSQVLRPSALPYPGDSLVAVVVSRDVFRADRRPAPVSYDPRRAVEPPPPPIVRPTLVLVGLVLGAQPAAVIEGFPGVEGGRVVRERDEVAGLRVRRIARDGVVVVGMDTTWVLKVREPWKK